jgi:hypothetical protein
LSNGLISGIRTDEKTGKLIQFTAPISPGNSGGPLFSSTGEVIGVISYTLKNSQNVNFAIDIKEVMNLKEEEGLWFPTIESESLTFEKSEVIRVPFGSSKYKVQGRERNAKFDEFGTLLSNRILAIQNNYSESLVYKESTLGELLVQVNYTLENEYLTGIRIENEGFDKRQTNAFSPPPSQKSYEKILQEFIYVLDGMDDLYGSPENWWYKNSSGEKFYKGEISALKSYNSDFTGQLKKEGYNIRLGWNLESENAEVWLTFYDFGAESTNYRAMWQLLIKKASS